MSLQRAPTPVQQTVLHNGNILTLSDEQLSWQARMLAITRANRRICPVAMTLGSLFAIRMGTAVWTKGFVMITYCGRFAMLRRVRQSAILLGGISLFSLTTPALEIMCGSSM